MKHVSMLDRPLPFTSMLDKPLNYVIAAASMCIGFAFFIGIPWYAHRSAHNDRQNVLVPREQRIYAHAAGNDGVLTQSERIIMAKKLGFPYAIDPDAGVAVRARSVNDKTIDLIVGDHTVEVPSSRMAQYLSK